VVGPVGIGSCDAEAIPACESGTDSEDAARGECYCTLDESSIETRHRLRGCSTWRVLLHAGRIFNRNPTQTQRMQHVASAAARRPNLQ
jgi:hypothetical protein